MKRTVTKENLNLDKPRLYLDEQKKILVGVASGIARFYNVSPLFVRLLFILSAVTTAGVGYVVYIVLAVFMQDDPRESAKRKKRYEKRSGSKEQVT